MCKAPLIIAKTQQDVHQDWILPAQLDVEIDTFGAFQERFASPQKLQNFGKQFFFDNLSPRVLLLVDKLSMSNRTPLLGF